MRSPALLRLGVCSLLAVIASACGRSPVPGTESGCQTDHDCPLGDVCDPVLKECVEAPRPDAGECGDTSSDPLNCGQCGYVCLDPAGGVAECKNGECTGRCTEGLTACVAGPDGGGACVLLESNIEHCGACGNACPVPEGGFAQCVQGECDAGCPSGLRLCGQACVNVDADPLHCGECHRSCQGTSCENGLCSGEVCEPPRELCSGVCVNTQTDTRHCGACDRACAASGPGSVAVCDAGTCGISCTLSGYTACGTSEGGLTCAKLDSDPGHCGTCDRACAPPSGGEAGCQSGICRGTCPSGLSICGETALGGGKCVDFQNDPENCGKCGRRCTHCKKGECASGPLAAQPRVPTVARFGWQSLFDRFLDTAGNPCNGRIVLALSQGAFCFVAASGSMKCAGRVGTRDFGPSFTDTGLHGVDQILVSNERTCGSSTCSSICVHKTDDTVHCMGTLNSWGQLGGGSTSPQPTFRRWGHPTEQYGPIGTGNWDQICALSRSDHEVYCAGYNYGSTPSPAKPGEQAARFWVDPLGTVHLDDPEVFRVSNGRSGCQVRYTGLSCFSNPVGPAGDIVDGFSVSIQSQPGHCWLTGSGTVECNTSTPNSRPFGQGRVLAFAGDVGSDSLCAVFDDGSIRCLGSNQNGKLGTGNTARVESAVQVAGPGSVRLLCD